jgi:hypothetical protein
MYAIVLVSCCVARQGEHYVLRDHRCRRPLDHPSISREFLLHLIVCYWLNGDDFTGTVVNFKPRDLLLNNLAVQPAIKTELPDDLRMGLVDLTRELCVAHNISVVTLDQEVRRTYDFIIVVAQPGRGAEQAGGWPLTFRPFFPESSRR